MRNAVIIHGRPSFKEYTDPTIPSSSNNHWIPWLQKQLIIRGAATYTPEIPQSWDPEYQIWRTEIERYPINPETALIGHSFGAGFLLRWLTENPGVRVARTVLVAPSLGIGTDKEDFFSTPLDPKLAKRTSGLAVFWSEDDQSSIIKAVEKIRSTIEEAKIIHLPKRGHFTEHSLGGEEFPELIDELTDRHNSESHK